MLNLRSIKKPACFTYQFSHKLSATKLKNIDLVLWAILNAVGNVQVLLWNFTPPALGPETDRVYFRREHSLCARRNGVLSAQGLAKWHV